MIVGKRYARWLLKAGEGVATITGRKGQRDGDRLKNLGSDQKYGLGLFR